MMQILDRSKKKRLLNELKVFGIDSARELFIRTSKDKIRIFSGHLSIDEIRKISKIVPVEIIGLYAIKDVISRERRREVRLSVDGVHFWSSKISGKIIYLTPNQEESWFRGEDFYLNEEQLSSVGGQGFYVLASLSDRDLLGMGKLSNDKIICYLPKERRVRRT